MRLVSFLLTALVALIGAVFTRIVWRVSAAPLWIVFGAKRRYATTRQSNCPAWRGPHTTTNRAQATGACKLWEDNACVELERTMKNNPKRTRMTQGRGPC